MFGDLYAFHATGVAGVVLGVVDVVVRFLCHSLLVGAVGARTNSRVIDC